MPISKYYPIDFKINDNYVFFETLFSKPPIGAALARNVSSLLNSKTYNPMSTKNNDIALNTIQKSIDFLYKAAAFEKQKEEKLIQLIIQDNPKLAEQLHLSSTNDVDYIQLISNLNIVLKGSKRFEKEIDNEIERIKKRRQITDQHLLKLGKKKQLTQEQGEKLDRLKGTTLFGEDTLNPFFAIDGSKVFKSINAARGNWYKITSQVIERYLPQLFELKKNGLGLDSRTIAVMIERLSEEAHRILATEYAEILYKKAGQTQKEYIAKVEEIINMIFKGTNEVASEMDIIFKNITENESAIRALSSMADQYGIPYQEEIRQAQDRVTFSGIENIFRRQYKSLKSNTNRPQTFEKWLNQMNMSTRDFYEIAYASTHATLQIFYSSEQQSLINLIQNGFQGAIQGGKNTPTDAHVGRLFISTQVEFNPQQMQDIKSAQQALSLNDEKYYSLLQQIETFDGDINSYMQNLTILREHQAEQQKILEDLREKLKLDEKKFNEYITHIQIHDSVKGYTTINAGKKAFEGARFGKNIGEQVSFISNIIAQTGVGDIDVDWLIFALINCGRGMIGRNKKTDLENYLSAFVGFVMFEDALDLVDEIANAQINAAETYVNDIHIYNLNGIYVPNSYLLDQTAQRLSKIKDAVEEEKIAKNGSFFVELQTYNPSKLEGFSPDELKMPEARAWKEQSALALKGTQIKLLFLSAFSALLTKIQELMKQK